MVSGDLSMVSDWSVSVWSMIARNFAKESVLQLIANHILSAK